MAQSRPHCTKASVLMISAITSLLVVVGFLSLFVYFMGPAKISQLLGCDSLPLIYSSYGNGSLCNNFFHNMVEREGLSDFWSSQSSLYQTIITFLIAINGLIAAMAVIYIKNNSEEKAEETARDYIAGEHFDVLLTNKLALASDGKLAQAQKDFESSVELLYGALDNLDMLEKESREIKQQLRVIAEKVAMLDNEDSDGKDGKIIKGDV